MRYKYLPLALFTISLLTLPAYLYADQHPSTGTDPSSASSPPQRQRPHVVVGRAVETPRVESGMRHQKGTTTIKHPSGKSHSISFETHQMLAKGTADVSMDVNDSTDAVQSTFYVDSETHVITVRSRGKAVMMTPRPDGTWVFEGRVYPSADAVAQAFVKDPRVAHVAGFTYAAVAEELELGINGGSKGSLGTAIYKAAVPAVIDACAKWAIAALL